MSNTCRVYRVKGFGFRMSLFLFIAGQFVKPKRWPSYFQLSWRSLTRSALQENRRPENLVSWWKLLGLAGRMLCYKASNVGYRLVRVAQILKVLHTCKCLP